MKEYIRATHVFDNKQREWIYRGDRGEDKFDVWNSPEVTRNISFRPILPRQWSMGVHALQNDHWMGINWIVDETISMYKAHASDSTQEFLDFITNTPNHREIIRQHIEDELAYLIEMDMVRVREK
jgi:hypothetical protein